MCRAPQIAARIEIDAGNATTGTGNPMAAEIVVFAGSSVTISPCPEAERKLFEPYIVVCVASTGIDRPLAATPKTIEIVSATARIVPFEQMRLVGGTDTFLRSSILSSSILYEPDTGM